MSKRPRRFESPWIQRQRPDLAGVVYRNVALMQEMREKNEQKQTVEEKIAEHITRFIGSMVFVYLHVAFIGLWVACNIWLNHPWDAFPFTFLAMIASVEAIFLSTFVLIRQNSNAKVTERHADLDLQMSLLTEHEVTRLLSMVDAIALHFKIPVQNVGDVQELKQEVSHEKLLDEIAKSR